MKLIVSRAVCAAAAVAILCAATAASAQPPAKNGFYAGFGAGADFPSDIPFSVHVNGGGLAVAVAGHVNLDTSAAGSATFGYRFNDYFATEGEFGYADFGIGSINLKVSALGLSKSGKFGLDGDVQAFTGFANLVVTPWGAQSFHALYRRRHRRRQHRHQGQVGVGPRPRIAPDQPIQERDRLRRPGDRRG
jgi:hypothetical protein